MPLGNQILQVTNAETRLHFIIIFLIFLMIQQMMMVMKMLSGHILMECSPRTKKETNGSGVLSVSCGIMKTVCLVAVTMLHLHAVLTKMDK